MSDVELRHGAATDVGLVRETNEDSFLATPPVFVVADGMGGHDRGDVASRIVVERFEALAATGYEPDRAAEAVATTLGEAQAEVAAYDASQRARGATRFAAGTTAVVALLVEGVAGPDGVVGPAWLVANLGDSRAYRVVGGTLEQLTRDHSLVQELLDAGLIGPDEVATHPERHVVTRALGGSGSVEADVVTVPLAGTSRLLLCSDGITGMLDDAQVGAVLTGWADPQQAADELVAQALAAGGVDNATAVVVDVVGWSSSDDPTPTLIDQEPHGPT